jgi:putative cell wall-binding protein
VSAKTPSSPSTQRIAGADRYETATLIARNQIGAAAPTGLVIASGETPYDALAGAVLTSATKPMLLVRKDSIPSTVADFLSDFKSSLAVGQPVVHVLGGESAVSAEVLTAIQAAVTTTGDLTPPLVIRVSGADRYATAKAISDVAGITTAADTLIIASGQNWADALSAGPLSAKLGWPIVLTTSTGVEASAKAKIDSYLALAGSVKKVLIIGGPAAVSTAVEEYLVASKAVPVANIRRIAGADRYNTNFFVNVYMLSGVNNVGIAAGGQILGGAPGGSVALVSGQAPWDALVAASWAANSNSHLVLSPTVGGNADALTLSATLAGLADLGLGSNSSLWILGGRNAVADSAKTAYIAASGTDLTSTLVCPTKGSDSFRLLLSGRLAAGAQADAATVGAGMAPLFKVNGVAQTAGFLGGSNLSDLSGSVNGMPSRQNYGGRLAAVPTVGQTIEFLGWAEGVTVGASYIPTRSIAGSTCTVGNDVTAPTITMRVIPGANGIGSTTSAGVRVLVSSSEPVTMSASTRLHMGGVPVTGDVTQSALNGSPGSGVASEWLLQAFDATISAGAVATLSAAATADVAGNYALVDASATAAADVTSPTITVASTKVVATTASAYTAGPLKISGLSILGAAQSGYSMTVTNQRGLLVPTISIDSTAKTITVVADTGYHTVADLAAVALNSWYTDATLGDWEVGASATGTAASRLTATVVPATCALTCGESTVTLGLSSAEPFRVGSGITVTVGGLTVPFVKVISQSPAATSYSTTGNIATGLGMSTTVTFTTTTLGAGTISFAGDVTGAYDVAGNFLVAPATFSIS